jgi:hypothetical protein
VDLCGAESVSVLGGVFFDGEFVEEGLDVLEIGHVASGTDDGVVPDGMETLDVLEPGQRSI